jgi:hypothetical protein
MDNDQSRFAQNWPAEQIAAINDAVKGHTVEGLEIYDARSILITFADGLQLRIECEGLKAIEPIEPQHI